MQRVGWSRQAACYTCSSTLSGPHGAYPLGDVSTVAEKLLSPNEAFRVSRDGCFETNPSAQPHVQAAAVASLFGLRN